MMYCVEASEYPRTSYFVCYTSRSGSTLLCDGLESTGVAGRPEEYFNPRAKATLQDPHWTEEARLQEFPAYLERVLEYGTTPNGVFGTKLVWGNLIAVTRRMGERTGEYREMAKRLHAYFPDAMYIWVTRRDKVRQAVSLYRAQQSDDWIRIGEERNSASRLVFNYDLIDRVLRHIVDSEAQWARYFASAGIVPVTVVYEDLVASYEPTVRDILDRLGIPGASHFRLPPPRVQRQSDALSEEWVERYEAMATRRRDQQKLAALPAVMVRRELWGYYVRRPVTQWVRRLMT